MAVITNNIKDFKTLEVTNKIRALVNDIYRITVRFPCDEKYGVVSQMRRAVTSIGANVAEGNGQMYPNKEINFMNNAIGSLSETRYWILCSLDRSYISETDYNELEAKCLEIARMLYGCVRRLKTSLKNSDIA